MERITIECPKCKKTEVIDNKTYNKPFFIECRKCGYMFRPKESKILISK